MLSIYPEIRERFIAQYKDAPINLASFYKPYKVCGMDECFGLCCNGGSGFYYPEEHQTIARVAAANPEFFAAQGIPLPEELFDKEVDEETGEVELSTNTREVKYPDGLLPPHFPSTACVFRAPNGFCSLQSLSLKEGHDSWYYKPVACWLFPIELEHGGKPFIHVAHHDTDEYIDEEYPGFVGFTKCGAECKTGGTAAYKILEKEIKVLSEWLGRDLLSEIIAYGEEKRLIA